MITANCEPIILCCLLIFLQIVLIQYKCATDEIVMDSISMLILRQMLLHLLELILINIHVHLKLYTITNVRNL